MPFDVFTPDQPISAEAALLSQALSLISDKRHWCQGRMRRWGDDGPRYCMLGAIRQASGRTFWFLGRTERNAMETLRKECKKHGYDSVGDLNDHTYHRLVLSAMRGALAKEMAKVV